MTSHKPRYDVILMYKVKMNEDLSQIIRYDCSTFVANRLTPP